MEMVFVSVTESLLMSWHVAAFDIWINAVYFVTEKFIDTKLKKQ